MYTPSMALTSHRAEAVGLAQGLAFGVMNTAWAFGELVGPTAGGALAESYGDAVPYLVGASLSPSRSSRRTPWQEGSDLVRREHWNRKYVEAESLWARRRTGSSSPRPPISYRVARSISRVRRRAERPLARRARVDGHGVDFSDVAITRARERHAREHAIEFVCADLDYEPEPGFDSLARALPPGTGDRAAGRPRACSRELSERMGRSSSWVSDLTNATDGQEAQ